MPPSGKHFDTRMVEAKLSPVYSRPYTVVSCCGITVKCTPWNQLNSSPMWEFLAHMETKDPNVDVIDVQVWNWRPGFQASPDEFVGGITIPLSNLGYQIVSDQWYPLMRGLEHKGDIRVRVKPLDFGLPPMNYAPPPPPPIPSSPGMMMPTAAYGGSLPLPPPGSMNPYAHYAPPPPPSGGGDPGYFQPNLATSQTSVFYPGMLPN